MRVLDLGLIDYEQALSLQLDYHQEVLAGKEEVLLLLEHLPVITLGRHGGEENLLLPQNILEEKGIKLVKSSRGGNITCHFPGQVVAYPIFRLSKRPGGIKRFFWDLEEVILQTLLTYEIKARRIQGLSGVFVGEKKIASIGIGVKKWVSYHGLALNVTEDLSVFRYINPCGLGRQMTSIYLESKYKPSLKQVKEDLLNGFKKVFA
ncbi:MAG: lipoyl(octanoyl) transferase [Desulfonauticus sp.]|jgi:lipoyl(octanoyl) transferase|nr:lipoyl(octanoyl) transferase [Desulfonauticus sp.]